MRPCGGLKGPAAVVHDDVIQVFCSSTAGAMGRNFKTCSRMGAPLSSLYLSAEQGRHLTESQPRGRRLLQLHIGRPLQLRPSSTIVQSCHGIHWYRYVLQLGVLLLLRVDIVRLTFNPEKVQLGTSIDTTAVAPVPKSYCAPFSNF
jgi:hypothetical protein